VVPEGAVARGRLRTLRKCADASGYYVVGLEITELEIDGHPRMFFADLLEVQNAAGATRTVGNALTGGSVSMVDLPGVGFFFVHGDRFELPKGFKTLWKTRALE
jgi:hypothetical protein